MASEMSGSGDEQEEVSILERILKILIVVLGLSMLYSYVEPIVTELTRNAQNDRVTRDFTIIADAIGRYQLAGKKYSEQGLAGLVNKKLIEELPRDPWGNEYIYNWCFEELVSPGPNRVLNTFVPLAHNEASEPENDDKVKYIAPISKLVFFTTADGVSQIIKADLDGVGVQAVEEVPGEIQGLSILSNTKLIVYSLKRSNAFDLRTVDFGTSERTDLTSDAAQDLLPVWASLKNNYLIFESDRGAPGALSLYGMQLPSKEVKKLVDRPSGDPGASVMLADRRIIYYSAGGPDRPSIQSLTLPDGQPQEVVSGRGLVLHPCASPNGIYLAYVIHEAQGASVEVIEIKSKKQIYKKDGASPKGFIAWSPDGDKLAFQVAADKGLAKLVVAEPLTGRSFVHPQFVMSMGRFAWIK